MRQDRKHGTSPSFRDRFARRATTHCRHRPRKRATQYSETSVIKPQGRGVLGRLRAAGMRMAVIARSTSDEAIHTSACGGMDCFASLAMTARHSRLALTRAPAFRQATTTSSFRDAPLGAGPESITTNVDVARSWGRSAVHSRASVVMDSGLALRAPRNDEGNLPDGQISKTHVQPRSQKYSASRLTHDRSISSPSHF